MGISLVSGWHRGGVWRRVLGWFGCSKMLQDATLVNQSWETPPPTSLPPPDTISMPTSHPPPMPYMVPFNPEDVLQNKQIDAPHIPEVFLIVFATHICYTQRTNANFNSVKNIIWHDAKEI